MNSNNTGKWALGISLIALGFSMYAYMCPRKITDQDAASSSDKLKGAVMEVIKNNPQTVMDAMGEGMAKKRDEAIKQLGSDVASNKEELTKMGLKFGDTSSNSSGTTVLAFVDPMCEHCRKFEQDMVKLVKSRKDASFVIVPVAVIGPDSLTLAKVYYAVNEVKPEKTLDVIEYLANTKDKIDKGCIEKALKSVELSYKDIEKALEEGDKKVGENGKMAKKLEIPVVPAVFVVEGSSATMLQEPNTDSLIGAFDKGGDTNNNDSKNTETFSKQQEEKQ